MTEPNRRVRVISGAGRYADPWHDFPATSARIAEIAAGLGHRVELEDDVERSLAGLDGVDLVIINIGNPERHGGESDEIGEAFAGLRRHLAAGGSLLSVHVSATSFPGVESWEEIIGGRWVDGTSMHPPIDLARLTVHPDRHPVVAGLADFTVWDERYSYLRVDPEVVPLVEHRHDDRLHPLVWAREQDTARIGYDALGHGVESYQSADRVRLLEQEITWLLA